MHISDSYFDFDCNLIERDDAEAEQLAIWETQYIMGKISCDEYISFLADYGDDMQQISRYREIECYKNGLTTAEECLDTIKDFIEKDVADYNFDTWIIPKEYAITLYYPLILPYSEDDEF